VIASDPNSSSATKWFGGAVIPIILAAYAVRVLALGGADIPARGGVLQLSGLDAVLYAVCILMLASAVHSALFWANDQKLNAYSSMGVSLGLLGFIGALAYLIARQFMNLA
jgi:hypothetical protein